MTIAMKMLPVVVTLCLLSGNCLGSEELKIIPLSELDLSQMSQGWGRPVPKKNVVKQNMRISGKEYGEGVGTHAISVLHLALDGQVVRFTAEVGIDESAGKRGSVRFQIFADKRLVFDSDVMHGGEQAKPVDVNLQGVKELLLFVDGTDDGIDFDHADWANAVFYYQGQPPKTVPAPSEPKEILTPKPGPAPQLNHAGRYGCGPSDFLPLICRLHSN